MAASTEEQSSPVATPIPPNNTSPRPPVIARSNPFNDLRPFIEHLWKTKKHMCENIYPDQFPRGEKGSATKQEEDAFLLCHFDANSLHTHGGRFLKQALYAIAKYNEDSVLDFARDWALRNRDFYEDRSMLMGMCGSVAQIKNFFDAEETAKHPETFLERAILAIRYGLQKLYEAQTAARADTQQQAPQAAAARADLESDELKTYVEESALQSSDGSVADETAATSSEQGLRTSISEIVPEQALVAPSHAEGLRLELSAGPPVYDPPAMTAMPLHQNQRYEAIQFRQVPGSRTAANTFVNMRTERLPSRSLSPNMPVSMTPMTIPQGAVLGYHPGQVSVVPTYHLDENYHPQSYQPQYTQVYGPHLAKGPSTGAQHQNRTRQSSFNNHYRPSDIGYGEGPRNVFPYGRTARGSFENSNNMDPNSFERLPNNKRGNKSGGYRGGRRESVYSSEDKGSSGRVADGPRGRKDASYELRNRRFFSDQPPFPPFSGPDRAWQTRDAVLIPYGPTGRRYSQDVRQYDPQNFQSVPNDDSDWSCREDFIGLRRSDVTSLVMIKVPNSLSEDEIFHNVAQVCRVVKVDRVSPVGPEQSLPYPPQHSSIFLSFPTMEETRRVLAMEVLWINNHNFRVAVPMRYINPNHPHYVSPGEAAERIWYGFPYETRRVHVPSPAYVQSAPRYIPGPPTYQHEDLRPGNFPPERRPNEDSVPVGRDLYNIPNSILGHKAADNATHHCSVDSSSGLNEYPLNLPTRSDTALSSPHGLDPYGAERTLKKNNTGKKGNKKKRNVNRIDVETAQLQAAGESNKHKLALRSGGTSSLQTFHDDVTGADLKSASSETLRVSTPVEQGDVSVPSEVVAFVDGTGSQANLLIMNTATSRVHDQELQLPTDGDTSDRQLSPISSASFDKQDGDTGKTGTDPLAASDQVKPQEQPDGIGRSASASLVDCFTPDKNHTDAAQSTPKKFPSSTHGRQSSSPRLTEDVDESFQTAAETPESTKSTTRDAVAAYHANMDLARESTEIHLASTCEIPQGAQAIESLPSLCIEAANVKNDTNAHGLSSGLPITELASSSVSKPSAVPKIGPRQTESLSPFARAPVPKKSDKRPKAIKKSRLKTEVKQDLGKGVIADKLSDLQKSGQASETEDSGGQGILKDNDPGATLYSTAEVTVVTERDPNQIHEPVTKKHSFFTAPLAALGALGEKISGKTKADSEQSKTPSPTKPKVKSVELPQVSVPPQTDLRTEDVTSDVEPKKVAATPMSTTAVALDGGSLGAPSSIIDSPVPDSNGSQTASTMKVESVVDDSIASQKKPIKRKKNPKGKRKLVANPEQSPEASNTVSQKLTQYVILDDDDEEMSSASTVTAKKPEASRPVSVELMQPRTSEPNSSHLVEPAVRKFGKKRPASGKPQKISSTPLQTLHVYMPDDFKRFHIVPADKEITIEDREGTEENNPQGRGQIVEQGGAHLANITAVQQSKFKIAEMMHQEKVRKLKITGDTDELEKEEESWQAQRARYRNTGSVEDLKTVTEVPTDNEMGHQAYTYRRSNEDQGRSGPSFVLTEIMRGVKDDGGPTKIGDGTYSVSH